MRVVGGIAKGRRLKGAVSPGTRNTTERVRAAIFNILSAELYNNSRVLDLYSGSGSLGIEALSRGAVWADFVEHNRRQCQVIHANLTNSGMHGQAAVFCDDVIRMLDRLPGPYALIMMDPPYRLTDLDAPLERISDSATLVESEGVVVVGHSKRQLLKSNYGPLQLFSHRAYGDNLVDFFVRE